MTPSEFLKGQAASFGLSLNEGQLFSFEAFTQTLISANTVMNLTAITDPMEIANKHYADSLSLLTLPCFTQGASVIDVGTGAGFPGIPLKLARKDLDITLLDTLRKRIDFLEKACLSTGLLSIRHEKEQGFLVRQPSCEERPIKLIWARAEEAARAPALRESYDIAVSRAVAELPALLEYCLPFVKPGGFFVAMKGPDPSAEIAACEAALSLLGAKLEGTSTVCLPSGITHSLVWVKKISQISVKYPRNFAKIAKSPL